MNDTKKKHSLRAAARACVALFTSFSVFVFAPIDTYLNNVSDLDMTLNQFAWGLVVCFALCFCALWLVLLLADRLNGRLGTALMLLLFGGTLAFYIQGNFLNIGAAQLTGDENEYAVSVPSMVINTAIWAAITALPLALWLLTRRKHGDRALSLTRFVSLFLTAIQLFTSVFTVSSILPQEQKRYYLTNHGMTNVSDSDNVIVFILDNVADEYLSRMIRDDPELLSEFTGFTHYPNIVGSYCNTAGSFALLMTGQKYLNQTSFGEFTAAAMTEDKLWPSLRDMGYSIFLGEGSGSSFDMREEYLPLFDNLDSYSITVPSEAALLSRILHLTLFRFAPELLRPYLYVYKLNRHINNAVTLKSDSGWERFTYENEVFKDSILQTPLTAQAGKRFLLYFLYGSHPPTTLNEFGETVAEYGNDLYTPLKGCMYILSIYLKQLKELGVYDNSSIIITSDHPNKTDDADTMYTIRSPILMVKPKNAQGFVVDNHAPVSFEDIRPTIAVLAGGDGSQFGTSVFDWHEGDERERLYYIYSWSRNFNSDTYFTPITEYSVSEDMSTRTRTGNVYQR